MTFGISSSTRISSGLALGLIVLSIPAASVVLAHPARLAAAGVKVDSTGRFRVIARFDLLAFALNDTPARIDDASMNQLLDSPAHVLRERLEGARQRFLLDFCLNSSSGMGIVDEASVKFPTVADVSRWRDAPNQSRLPVMQDISFEGDLPPGATSIEIWFPEVLGPVVLSVERPGEEPFSEPVAEGAGSSILPIRLSNLPASEHPQIAIEPGRMRVGGKYLALGFRHIVPHGPDHILFVLGLFLLSTSMRPLLWQVTAFTVAHSITLGLALYGLVRVPAGIIEPLIALSIAFIAVENLFTSELHMWRPVVVFGFGLVHGLGFAGVLADTGLPRSQFATALLTFNIGVELGQLAVIALAFAAVGWWMRSQWYRRGIVLPTSTLIGAIAVFWTIQRVWGEL